ncbi:isopentenyl-diphosphate delta-isomerase II 2 [Natrialba magadii ATCC 43099]|uniref:Isopentenyl-diphosphate delta-isomerase II 2 n=1 Tax=Natrialba magadii (strain ATCC 43099 / DSM 3394 / CCM 3739 / CIP 104546 / IAM 13178 / JCM 8861 / NBRC 102185 / NCIMB 2190 / MS3) TaxID=547559 RepID=D3SRD3_NATMM|nr:hypothetical protein [Natrialba magadii]ADD04638.1 isopentenyl-diphosphate delta-isomerase II 2 [Natrialba magadii ATCC 43099]ELY25293.1 isopentenyl-diphosphate delta-isomerase II 2 [Natrialba magadii ATCC 43099]
MTTDNPQYGPNRQVEVSRRGMLEAEQPAFHASYEHRVEQAREKVDEVDRPTIRRAD